MAGVEVGGLERDAAASRIQAAVQAKLERPVTVRVGEREFTTTPAELYRLDLPATEQAAFDAGRSSLLSRLGTLTGPFVVDRELEPVLAVRPGGQSRLAAQLDRLTARPVSARAGMAGTSAVVVPAKDGTVVDQTAFAEDLRLAALSGSGAVTAQLTPAEPAVTTVEAARAATTAELVASAAVGIELKGEPVGALSAETLASLVRFQPANGSLRVVLARDAVGRELEPMVAGLTREPVDASFRVDGKRAHVVRAKPGTTLSAGESARTIRTAALKRKETGGRVAAVGLTSLEAGFSTRDARALGIRGQLASFTTDMGVSSSNRIHNVLLMGEYLDGTILKPGQVFSFNGTVGPRTVERGFVEGHMILGGLLVPSIGGGVCQVATTVFNAAFESGLPITERHNHSFYISHYPTGRDATVSWGGPNLVFRNDLDHAILIKASGNTATFTVSFYGTRQGRKVTATTSAPTNYTSPALQYAVDPSAPPGSVRTEPGGGPGLRGERPSRRSRGRQGHPRGRLLHAVHAAEPDRGLRPRPDAARSLLHAALLEGRRPHRRSLVGVEFRRAARSGDPPAGAPPSWWPARRRRPRDARSGPRGALGPNHRSRSPSRRYRSRRRLLRSSSSAARSALSGVPRASRSISCSGSSGMPVYSDGNTGWDVRLGRDRRLPGRLRPRGGARRPPRRERRWDRRLSSSIAAMLTANVVIYLVGVPWLAQVGGLRARRGARARSLPVRGRRSREALPRWRAPAGRLEARRANVRPPLGATARRPSRPRREREHSGSRSTRRQSRQLPQGRR